MLYNKATPNNSSICADKVHLALALPHNGIVKPALFSDRSGNSQDTGLVQLRYELTMSIQAPPLAAPISSRKRKRECTKPSYYPLKADYNYTSRAQRFDYGHGRFQYRYSMSAY